MFNLKFKIFNKNLFSKLKSKRNVEYLLAIVLSLIVVVIFISSCSKSKSSSTKKTTTSTTTSETSATLSYSQTIENKLVSVLERMKGCGSVRAMVVTDSSEVNEIAYSDEDDDEGTKVPIYEKNGSSEVPYVKKIVYPKIVGVLIVASGAGDANIKLKIVNAVSSTLGIEVSKIEVLEGK